MKIRTGFVSNSSSSSYIVRERLPKVGTLKISEEQAAKILGDSFEEYKSYSSSDDWFLTEEVFDYEFENDTPAYFYTEAHNSHEGDPDWVCISTNNYEFFIHKSDFINDTRELCVASKVFDGFVGSQEINDWLKSEGISVDSIVNIQKNSFVSGNCYTVFFRKLVPANNILEDNYAVDEDNSY